MKTLTVIVLAAASAAAHADIFDDLKTAKPAVDPKIEIRESYYRALQNGEKPSVESVRDFLLPGELERLGLSSLKKETYFQAVMPYFYDGLKGEGMQWSGATVQIVKEQRAWCVDKKEEAQKAFAELNSMVKTAPVGQYGQQVHPQAQQNRVDAIKGGIAGICMGVDPTGLHGNQVWSSMEKSITKTKKGDF